MNHNVLNYTYDELITLFASQWNKGEFHAKALFSQLYKTGSAQVSLHTDYAKAQALAHKVEQLLPYTPMQPSVVDSDGDNIKFKLQFSDGGFAESVVIAMKNYKTLCVSSQVGCKRGCNFCLTGQMGLIRNLTTAEIVEQYMCARFVLGETQIENIVFMGMGEPLDNFDAVVKAIDIFADQHGIRISPTFITLSTVGDVDNIKRFGELIVMDQAREAVRTAGIAAPTAFRNLKFAVSLHATNDTTRNNIMPTNRKWNMASLKQALIDLPIKRKDHDLFIEYTLIPTVNDNASELATYLSGLPCVINLIAYNPVPNLTYPSPTMAQMEKFKIELEALGLVVRLRKSKGESILAACGQLGVLNSN